MAAKPSQYFNAAGLIPITHLMFAPTESADVTLPYAQPQPPLPSPPAYWARNINFPGIGTIFSRPPVGVQQA